MLNKSHPLSRYETNSGKNKEKCLMHFGSDATVFVIINWQNIQLCNRFSSVIFIYLIPLSQIIVRTNRLHDFNKGICFPDKCCYENC